MESQTIGRRRPRAVVPGPAPAVRLAWLGPAYFAAYLAYLFARPESESLHWVSLVAVPFGLVLGALQLLLSSRAGAIRGFLEDGSIAWLLPIVFLLMFLTAGFTEELFFRGFLQPRLERLTGSAAAGLVLASLCFGLYHLPYAYLNPRWPSAGDWGAAWTAALGQGVPGGLILGGVYLGSRRNVVACAVVHALINTLPGLTMVHFGGP